MELIKKYNYEDPLHMKGDPFGAADAKVAHVNQLITEVNSQTASVNSLTSRVETLENAPAPTSEYYVNGRILQYEENGNPVFIFNVDAHNTPVVDSNDGNGHNTLQGLFQFMNGGSAGSYVCIMSGNVINIGTQEDQILAAFSSFTLTSCVVQPLTTLYNQFNNANRAFNGISISSIDFSTGSQDQMPFWIDVMTTAVDTDAQSPTFGYAITTPRDVPNNGILNSYAAVNIMSVQLRFKDLKFNV